MDRQTITSRSELERILFDDSAEPKALPLSLLDLITNSFSDDRVIGCGGFATVYKGMLGNGAVAVKKLFERYPIHDKEFKDEVRCLMKAKHKNILRLLGFCYETRWEKFHIDGELDFAEVRQRLLCSEYIPKGCLNVYITDASCGLEWSKRYKIITGICDGLYYLHQKRILHLDLKPANILLDDNLMPKIADFGLSRCFSAGQSQAIASKVIGTMGYLAPEFVAGKHITFMLDIYSLGIIITEILTGVKGYFDIDNVLEMWNNRLEKSQRDSQLVQVKVCTEIAMECINFNPAKRPDIQHIIDRLGATNNMDEFATETMATSSPSSAHVRSEMTQYGEVASYSAVERESITSLHETSGSEGLELDPAIELQMDHRAITARIELENMLFDESIEPKPLPLSLLEHITSGFSEDKNIGDGGFAKVYKGMLKNGTIAVKKLCMMVDTDEKQFSEEIRCLMKAKHKNIVRFLGYCSDTQGEMVTCDGKLVLADFRERLLCFEYLPNGSLDKKITDASKGLEWRKRYQIINGICDGLYHLHKMHIIHFDLKPENILLDDNMMPKIADFGLSKCFDENQSHAIASKVIGTIGYLAPEFIHGSRLITFEADIFSLGIIMVGIITGEKAYPYPDIDNVLESWRNRLEKPEVDTQLVQVRVCTEIAIECIDINPEKRPDIQHIIGRLGATKSVDGSGTEIGTSG